MLTKFYDEKEILYDGSQLRPLHNYLVHGLLGDSMVTWIGPCNIPFSHMVDGEDLRAEEVIAGDKMLHAVVELFDTSLLSAVALQRLMAERVIVTLKEMGISHSILAQCFREGDDVYFLNSQNFDSDQNAQKQKQKLSISIATRSINSVLIHFAVNITNQGTPVSTCCLEDFNVDAREFCMKWMAHIQGEWQSIREATYKVRAVTET
jgi:uncharacterized protein